MTFLLRVESPTCSACQNTVAQWEKVSKNKPNVYTTTYAEYADFCTNHRVNQLNVESVPSYIQYTNGKGVFVNWDTVQQKLQSIKGGRKTKSKMKKKTLTTRKRTKRRKRIIHKIWNS